MKPISNRTLSFLALLFGPSNLSLANPTAVHQNKRVGDRILWEFTDMEDYWRMIPYQNGSDHHGNYKFKWYILRGRGPEDSEEVDDNDRLANYTPMHRMMTPFPIEDAHIPRNYQYLFLDYRVKKGTEVGPDGHVTPGKLFVWWIPSNHSRDEKLEAGKLPDDPDAFEKKGVQRAAAGGGEAIRGGAVIGGGATHAHR